MDGNQINGAFGAEFTGRRTCCRRQWMEIRSTRQLVLNSQETHHLWVRMDGNQINNAVGVEFTG